MDRSQFLAPALEVAPRLLGARLSVDSECGKVTVRITEVEAYHGVGTPGPYDAGSHARDRLTARNASMFGPPGHAYVYLSYGVHYALNLVCSPEGAASGVLIRAGEVVDGAALALRRRELGKAKRAIRAHELARGPGNLAQALGIHRDVHNGSDVFSAPFELHAPEVVPGEIARGPRVGVSGHAGSTEFAWRFWLTEDPTVSAYRPGRNVPGRYARSVCA